MTIGLGSLEVMSNLDNISVHSWGQTLCSNLDDSQMDWTRLGRGGGDTSEVPNLIGQLYCQRSSQER